MGAMYWFGVLLIGAGVVGLFAELFVVRDYRTVGMR